MADRISSLDAGYETGDLSVYPSAIDSRETLYEVRNNAETYLTHSLTYTGRFIQAADTSRFPPRGLLSVGTELIYYGTKTQSTFKDLIRPFAGSIRRPWPAGSKITNSVAAEPHNAVKDAIINLQKNLGLLNNPDAGSLHGILQQQEQIYLAPKPLFRATPRFGPPPLKVRFQNFSSGRAIRFLWDFGDGVTSTEENPIHIFLAEGLYSVKLNMITDLGATGVATKDGYVRVSEEDSPGFFYVTPTTGTVDTVFTFIDQTRGDIASRHWIWDDGETEAATESRTHVATHQYSEPGTYSPNLLLVFSDGRPMRVALNDFIEVTE